MKEFLMCRFDDSNIDENSIIIDVGAHEGQFIDFFSKYDCYIYSYEPIKTFYNNIKNKESEKVKIFNFAVGKEDNKEIKSIVKKIGNCGFSYEEGGKGPNYYFWKEQ